MKQIKNIVTAANNDYIKYLLVMLKSLFENNRESHFHVYVLNRDIQKTENDALVRLCNSYKNEVFILNVDDKYFSNVRKEEFTVEAYFRLKMFDLLPQNVERALYLDVDIIINKNIEEFYNLDFNGKLIAACTHDRDEKEMLLKVRNGEILPERGDCFNSGVMLYNVKLIRQLYSTRDFFEVIESKDYYYDQGVLNFLFWDKAKYIDTKLYNNRGYKEVNVDDIVIIHYASDNPWEMLLDNDDLKKIRQISIFEKKMKESLNGFYLSLVNIWWEYAEKTEYYNLMLSEAKIKHDYFMKRIVSVYFYNIDKDVKRLKANSVLVDAILKYGTIANALKSKEIYSCALYGMGKIGRFIFQDLKENGFNILFYSDQKKYDDIDLIYKSLDELKNETCCLVVCVSYDNSQLLKKLQDSTNCKIYFAEELLK